MRAWRFAVPLVLVVLGIALLAPVLLLRDGDSSEPRAGHRDRGVATTGRTSPSSPASPQGEDLAISTSSSTYFGRPFKTISIEGRYPGVGRPTRLRVELRQGDGWSPFPLPAMTSPSGAFTAYVEMGGPGRYRLRIVDPQRNATSAVLELVVF